MSEGTFELTGCEAMLLREIANRKMHQRDIAQTYALSMRSSEKINWARVNLAIIERWSRSGLERVKTMAWSGKCWEATPTE